MLVFEMTSLPPILRGCLYLKRDYFLRILSYFYIFVVVVSSFLCFFRLRTRHAQLQSAPSIIIRLSFETILCMECVFLAG